MNFPLPAASAFPANNLASAFPASAWSNGAAVCLGTAELTESLALATSTCTEDSGIPKSGIGVVTVRGAGVSTGESSGAASSSSH